MSEDSFIFKLIPLIRTLCLELSITLDVSSFYTMLIWDTQLRYEDRHNRFIQAC